jgi:hypothetical protein
MDSLRLTARVLVFIALALAGCSSVASASGIGISTAPDHASLDSVNIERPFHAHRPGTSNLLMFRDLEFHWDRDYIRDSGSALSAATVSALNQLGRALVDTAANPFQAPYPDFQLVYEYFRREGLNYNTVNAFDTTAVVVGLTSKTLGYPARDRSHADYYLVNKPHIDSLGLHGGAYPSEFLSVKEDISTNSPVRTGNSMHFTGPNESGLDSQPWTAAASPQVWGFNHEFQHALPPSQPGRWSTEMFSAGAEAVGGVPRGAAAAYEVSYTASLLAHPESIGSCEAAAESLDNNYSGRRLFASYLAYNFRGVDTTAVLPGAQAGFSDDLLWQWAKSSTRTLSSLSTLLDDSPAHIAKIDPAGGATTSLSPDALFGFLHHNWRVATYLNAPVIGDGRYGYPVHFDFIPSEDTGAWKSFDCATNDVVVIPPKVTLAYDEAHRSITTVGTRLSDSSTVSHPMVLQPLGAEYWIARSGNMNNSFGRSLVVTVSGENSVASCKLGTGRLMASVAAYEAQTDSLWRKPEWVQDVQPPRWTDLDSLSSELEFVVSDFGNPGAITPRMAAVTTITLAGPGGLGTLGSIDSGVGLVQRAKYRITHDLAAAPYPQPFASPLPARLPLVANSETDDLAPAWSPGGQEIVYTSQREGEAPRAYRRAFSSGNMNQTQVPVHDAPDSAQSDPDWSPRGDWIVWAQDVGSGSNDLFAKYLPTDSLARLTTTNDSESQPVFQPNGQGLAFVRTNVAGGLTKHALYWRSLTGSFDSVLVGPGGDAEIRSPRWSWDGARVFFTRGDSVYTVRIAGRLVEVQGAPLGTERTTSLDVPRGAGAFMAEAIATSVDTCQTFPLDIRTLEFRRLAVKSPVANGPSWSRFHKRSTSFYGPRISLDGTRVAYAATESLSTSVRDLHFGILTYDHPPVMGTAVVDSTIFIGNRLVVNLATNASDPDGDAIYYKAAYLPPSATFSGSTFVWENPQPVGSDAMRYVVFVAYDSAGAQDVRVIRYTLVPGGSGGGCPFADVLTGSGWIEGNSISKRSASLAYGVDAYRLPEAPVLRGGRYSVRIRENEAEESSLDGVSLLLVDHAPGMRTLASGERILQGSFLEPNRVTDAEGVDLTDLFVGEGSPGRTMNPGEALLVEFGSPGAAGGMGTQSNPGGSSVNDEGGGYGMESGSKTIPEEFRTPPRAELASAGADDRILSLTGIDLQIPDGEGGWRTVERHYPRERLDAAAFEAIPPGPVRMLFAGRHQVRGLGRIVPAESIRAPQSLEPVVARHSRLGDLRSATTGEGNGAATLVQGDTLTLEFAASPPDSGLVRDFYLVTRGAYRAATEAAGAGSPGALQSAPLEFALGAARPNPSRGVTTIPFALPTRSVASLKVFNASGRLVRTLVARELEAGRHEIEWDRRADSGARVAAGMYFYQLVATGREATRKVVILGD